jgi:hypothetical protein
MNANVILSERRIDELHAEYDRLFAQRDAAERRMDEISKALVASGEARLRMRQEDEARQ